MQFCFCVEDRCLHLLFKAIFQRILNGKLMFEARFHYILEFKNFFL